MTRSDFLKLTSIDEKGSCYVNRYRILLVEPATFYGEIGEDVPCTRIVMGSHAGEDIACMVRENSDLVMSILEAADIAEMASR